MCGHRYVGFSRCAVADSELQFSHSVDFLRYCRMYSLLDLVNFSTIAGSTPSNTFYVSARNFCADSSSC